MPSLNAFTRFSSSDLSAKQGYVASQTDSTGKVTIANAQTLALVGIIVDGGKQSGAAVTIAGDGDTVQGILGGTVTLATGNVPQTLTADANGKLIVTTNASDMVVGIAMQGGSAGDYIEVQAVVPYLHK